MIDVFNDFEKVLINVYLINCHIIAKTFHLCLNNSPHNSVNFRYFFVILQLQLFASKVYLLYFL